MTVREICESNPTIGYYSGLSGIEIKKIENGIDDYVYCVSGAWSSKKRYHKLKVHYSNKGAYIVVDGTRYYMSEFLRT